MQIKLGVTVERFGEDSIHNSTNPCPIFYDIYQTYYKASEVWRRCRNGGGGADESRDECMIPTQCNERGN